MVWWFQVVKRILLYNFPSTSVKKLCNTLITYQMMSKIKKMSILLNIKTVILIKNQKK